MNADDTGFEKDADSIHDDVSLAIVERFRTWVAGVLEDEEPPQGIAAELLHVLEEEDSDGSERAVPADNAYALWSAMTALTQEVKLQGRSFKQLRDSLDPLQDLAPTLNHMMDTHAESLAEARRIANEALSQRTAADQALRAESEQRAQRALLGVLTDMRDRLSRNLEITRGYRHTFKERMKPTWLDRLLGRADAVRHLADAAQAQEKGYTLCLDRLDDALARLGVREVACLGEPFDPRAMVAADVEETSEAADGTVVEVYRTGYVWNGEVFQPAQVKVARSPQAGCVQRGKDSFDGE